MADYENYNYNTNGLFYGGASAPTLYNATGYLNGSAPSDAMDAYISGAPGYLSNSFQYGATDSYAGLGYDIDQRNAYMDRQSEADAQYRRQQDLIRSQQRYGMGGGTQAKSSGGASSGMSASQYAMSQPVALDIASIPSLQLTTPQLKEWDKRAAYAEIQKSAAPFLRATNRDLQQRRVSNSGLDPALRARADRNDIQNTGDSYSKILSAANQSGAARYAQQLNIDNQKLINAANIANQQATANYNNKSAAWKYNLGLGQAGINAPRYNVTNNTYDRNTGGRYA